MTRKSQKKGDVAVRRADEVGLYVGLDRAHEWYNHPKRMMLGCGHAGWGVASCALVSDVSSARKRSHVDRVEMRQSSALLHHASRSIHMPAPCPTS